MRLQNLILPFVVILLTIACKTKEYTPTSFPDAQIVFGEGGGFTGEYMYYYLLENGQIFTQKGPKGEFVPHSRIKSKKAEALFTQLKTIGLQEMRIKRPSNWSHFIEYKSKDIDHKVIWGQAEFQLPENVGQFYEDLMALIKPKS